MIESQPRKLRATELHLGLLMLYLYWTVTKAFTSPKVQNWIHHLFPKTRCSPYIRHPSKRTCLGRTWAKNLSLPRLICLTCSQQPPSLSLHRFLDSLANNFFQIQKQQPPFIITSCQDNFIPKYCNFRLWDSCSG